MIELKQILLEAPEGHIDQVALDSIREWDDEPKAIQVLKTLDLCVKYGLTSGFVVGTLEIILNTQMNLEGVTYEQVVEQAEWRKS